MSGLNVNLVQTLCFLIIFRAVRLESTLTFGIRKSQANSMKKNPSFRHFYSITLVISRLCGDGWRMEVTDGGMLGEELAKSWPSAVIHRR